MGCLPPLLLSSLRLSHCPLLSQLLKLLVSRKKHFCFLRPKKLNVLWVLYFTVYCFKARKPNSPDGDSDGGQIWRWGRRLRQKQYREQIGMTNASLTSLFIDLTSISSGKVSYSSLYFQHAAPCLTLRRYLLNICYTEQNAEAYSWIRDSGKLLTKRNWWSIAQRQPSQPCFYLQVSLLHPCLKRCAYITHVYNQL